VWRREAVPFDRLQLALDKPTVVVEFGRGSFDVGGIAVLLAVVSLLLAEIFLVQMRVFFFDQTAVESG